MPDPRIVARRYRWLADALTGGGLVLTGSRRLARELRRAYNETQRADGLSAWPTPAVTFWQDWLRESLTLCGAGSARIGGPASAVLWERCIRRHLPREELPAAGALARQVDSAWRRLNEWRIDQETLESSAATTDERAFARAARAYRAELNEHGWTDEAQMPELAMRHLDARDPPPKVAFAGFDRITPRLDELRRTLESSGTVVELIDPGSPPECVPLQAYPDEESEFRAAGQWARRVLESRPTASIAIVSTDLDQRAQRQSRLVREGLAPGWQVGSTSYSRAVNVSFGRRLADYPMIGIALTCLRFASGGLNSREISLLLRSPIIAGDEAAPRARLDRALRRLPDRVWTAAALADALADAALRLGARQWQETVRHIARLQGQGNERRAPSAWAAEIDRLLTRLGWPGSDALISEEYQLAARWRDLLAEFASLDGVLPALALVDSVHRVTNLARETIYQPDRGDGLVQLLGPLEAAGMEFDGLWIAGMDASRWPRPAGPMAFVSHRLQRESGMPDATPADSLEFSQRVLARLLRSATEVRTSWSRLELDADQIVTPLLDGLPVTAATDAHDPGWHASSYLAMAGDTVIANDPAPPARSVESVAGGARTVAWQQTEPFVAFARGRLGIRDLDRFQAGLPAWLRGELLHDALRELYIDRPSQAAIAAWDDSDRQRRIDDAVRRGMLPAERFADATLRRLLAIERTRLKILLDDFLCEELDRQPFEVQRIEERVEFRHAGVELVLRADRVDRLADGSSLIIDYKTGKYRYLLNRDKDPVDPQVVLYATATPNDVGGLALFNINRSEIRVSSAGPDGEWGKLGDDDWQRALDRWKAQVYSAIEALAAGDVRVNLLLSDDFGWQLNVLSRIEEVRRAR